MRREASTWHRPLGHLVRDLTLHAAHALPGSCSAGARPARGPFLDASTFPLAAKPACPITPASYRTGCTPLPWSWSSEGNDSQHGLRFLRDLRVRRPAAHTCRCVVRARDPRTCTLAGESLHVFFWVILTWEFSHFGAELGRSR